jgi:hypothetical protein
LPIGWYIPYVFLRMVLPHNPQPRVVGCARDHDRPQRRCANDNIFAGAGDHDKNQYARGPQDNSASGHHPLSCWLLCSADSSRLRSRYESVPKVRIRTAPQNIQVRERVNTHTQASPLFPAEPVEVLVPTLKHKLCQTFTKTTVLGGQIWVET